jgi:hypothetical protein
MPQNSPVLHESSGLNQGSGGRRMQPWVEAAGWENLQDVLRKTHMCVPVFDLDSQIY